MPDAFVMTSSAFLFVPAGIAGWRQQTPVFVALFGGALFSTLYHAYDEQRFEMLDVVWASFSVVAALLVWLAGWKRYGPTHWRSWVPIALGLAAMIIFFVKGSYEHTEDVENRPDDYEVFHSMWQIGRAHV